MNILIFPAAQIRPDARGQVRIDGFMGEVKGVTSEHMEVAMQSQNGDHVTAQFEFVAGGLYRWNGLEYAIFAPLNPSVGDVSQWVER